MVVDNVASKAKLMLAMRPPEVVGTGEAPVMAEGRIPILRVANVGKTGNAKERKAAVAHVIGIVGARNTNVKADVLAEVRSLAIFAHASKPYVTVNDEIRR